jgi:4'-phosphopantetheinyl transferase EntD
MPLLYHQPCGPATAPEQRLLGLWQLTETEEELMQQWPQEVALPSFLNTISVGLRRRQSIAVRLLAWQMLNELGFSPLPIHKSTNGRPVWPRQEYNLSFTHTAGWVAVQLAEAPHFAAIDLERIQPKLSRVAPRILHASEQEILLEVAEENRLLCTTFMWSAKETLYKAARTPGLDFKTQISIEMPVAYEVPDCLGEHTLRLCAGASGSVTIAGICTSYSIVACHFGEQVLTLIEQVKP